MKTAVEFERENLPVLNIVQAMIGSVTPNLRGVSLECGPRGAHLYFLLEHEDQSDREEIKDIAFELEALQSRGIDLEVSVLVSPEPLATGTLPGRRVFGRKEPWAGSRTENE
jgi:hypothetical protein